MSSGDDFETASDEDIIKEVERELNGQVTNDRRTYLDHAPSAYVQDIPETRGLLTEGKKQFLNKPFISRKLIEAGLKSEVHPATIWGLYCRSLC